MLSWVHLTARQGIDVTTNNGPRCYGSHVTRLLKPAEPGNDCIYQGQGHTDVSAVTPALQNAGKKPAVAT
jgi:hypothetical protein